MEQAGRGEEGKQQQDQGPRRSKLGENQVANNNPPQQPPPPQKCPRCDSLNTKFCYYNNYSLSQPRYFCKTCRRYWTQGGTLRNVPVGGGCRKGKRPKTSSSSSSTAGGENSRSLTTINVPPPPPLLAHQQQQLHLPPPPQMVPPHMSGLPAAASQSLRNLGWGHAPPSSLYPNNPSDGFLSSLTAMQSLGRPPQGIINQPINLAAATNMPMFQGFNFPSSMKSQPLEMHHHHHHHQSPGFQGMVMTNQEKVDGGEAFNYPPEQNLGQHARALNSWNHGDNNANNIPSSANPNFWNNSSGSSSSGIPGGSSGNPNQWPNLPGFGASP